MRDPTERPRNISVAIAAVERHVPRDQIDFGQDDMIQAVSPASPDHRRGCAGTHFLDAPEHRDTSLLQSAANCARMPIQEGGYGRH